jgi:type IV secretory pathway VirB10-like protein
VNGEPRDAGLRVVSTIAAVVINGGLFVGMALAGVIGREEPPPDEPEVIEFESVEILQKGKPRDPKLLPRIPTSPAPMPQEEKVVKTGPTEPEAPKPPDPDEIKLQQEREEKERQKQEAELRKLQEEEKKKRKEAIAKALERVGDEDEPPEGAEDGFEGGTTTDPTKSTAFLNYMGQLQLILRRNFEVPATISPDERRRLVARVVIRLGEDGKIKGDPVIEDGSGNRFYDDAAVRTVLKFSAGTPDKLPLPTDPKVRKFVLSTPLRLNMKAD